MPRRFGRWNVRLGPAAATAAMAVAACAGSHDVAAQSSGLTCSAREVVARGEPASYRWLAMLKARGNWRVKVRTLPGLGAPYANYASAQNPVERCIFNTGSIVCTVTATPCRR